MSKTGKDRAPPKTIAQLVNQLGYRHSSWQVFADFVEMGATAFSNAVDLAEREARETRYMEVVKRYQPEEVQRFPEMLATLVSDLEDEPEDVLGKTYHELELHNKWSGQYFTPFPLCRAMAKMIVGDAADLQQRIAERGFLTASEPASGSGAMVIALALELKGQGVNYQQQLHVTAVDVDAKCVHMTYLQLALLHIPAVVVHGNSLSLEEYGRWYTPAHIMNGWNYRLRRAAPVPEGEPQTSKPEGIPDQPDEPEKTPTPTGKPSQLTLF
jgi:N-6 DNA Methylase